MKAYNILLAILLLPAAVFFPQNKKIAVTLDDLPLVRATEDSSEFMEITASLLKHLKAFNIPAVGFVNENKLYENGNLKQYRVSSLKLWLENGFELGNHTYSHPSLNRTPLKDFIEDLEKGSLITKELSSKMNKPYRYFRHPFLHTGRTLGIRDSLKNYLTSNGCTVAPVTIDNSEWVFALAYENALNDGDTASAQYVLTEYIPYMVEKIRFYEKQSDSLFGYNINHILLIHANRLNAVAGSLLFKAISDEGYDFITLEEALTDPAYLSEDKFTGAGGISWLHRWALTKGKGKEFFKGETMVPDKVLKISGLESE